MRTRTAMAAVLIVSVLVGTAILGFSGIANSGGTLTERWVSSTMTEILGNHHAPAAGQIHGRGMVFAPISGAGSTHQCRLVAMNADSARPRWRYHVPPANCTIHSVADPALADFDSDGTKEVVVVDFQGVVFVLRANGTAVWTKNLAS